MTIDGQDACQRQTEHEKMSSVHSTCTQQLNKKEEHVRIIYSGICTSAEYSQLVHDTSHSITIYFTYCSGGEDRSRLSINVSLVNIKLLITS